MRELSVFCDESGDFGALTTHAPYFIVTLVLHEQSRSLERELETLGMRLVDSGMADLTPIHTAPLIRREERYAHVEGAMRRKLFDMLFSFFRRCPASYASFVIDKRLHGTGHDLQVRLARELGMFFCEHAAYFHSFDRVIVYYDKGQQEVSRVLRLVFSAMLPNAELRTVDPRDYVLFQCADLACTMELIEARRQESGLTKSESMFFGGAGRFKKTYLKAYEKKRFTTSAR